VFVLVLVLVSVTFGGKRRRNRVEESCLGDSLGVSGGELWLITTCDRATTASSAI
jgi:hypothetical protein